MAPSRRFEPLGILCVGLAVLVAAGAALAEAITTSKRDALELGKLAKSSISVDMKETDVVDVFRMISKLGAVPFVLEIQSDPALKLTFKAENLSLRILLQSIADTYGFEYLASDDGIIVRRQGAPPSDKRTTVGAWAPKPGPSYRLELQVRGARGEVLSTPAIAVATQAMAVFKQGLASGRDVVAFDRERLIAEPRYTGAVELNVCAKRESSAGLELLVETVVTRPLGENRYSEEHAVATMTVGVGEALLVKTDDGRQIVLKGWSRAPTGRGGE